MKFIKTIAVLVITVSVAITGVTLVKVIGVQRSMGEKQAALLGEVERQNRSVEEILPAFKPTEEMVAKTESMLADLKSLVDAVSEMNGLVQKANDLQAATAGLLDMNNLGIGILGYRISASRSPLVEVRDCTALTLQYINSTLGALQEMIASLRLSNAYASDIADMMEGKYR